MKILILKYKNKISTLPKVKTITDVMKSLKFKESLDDKKIKSLLNLKIKDDQMFSLKNPNFLVEVTFLINTLGFEKSYNFLKTQVKDVKAEKLKLKQGKLEAQMKVKLFSTLVKVVIFSGKIDFIIIVFYKKWNTVVFAMKSIQQLEEKK